MKDGPEGHADGRSGEAELWPSCVLLGLHGGWGELHGEEACGRMLTAAGLPTEYRDLTLLIQQCRYFEYPPHDLHAQHSCCVRGYAEKKLLKLLSEEASQVLRHEC